MSAGLRIQPVGTSRYCVLVGLVFFSLPGISQAQIDPTDGTIPSAQHNAPKSGLSTPREKRAVSLKKLPPKLLDDQAQIWTFPAKVVKGEHWISTLSIAGTAAALIAQDPHDTPYFRRRNSFSVFNSVFSGITAAIGIAVVPTSFHLVDLKPHDAYAEKTALFAGVLCRHPNCQLRDQSREPENTS